MIPSDLAARLRFLHEASLFETSPPVAGLQRTREIQSQLQELVPGQRFLATLQRTLPNGTFRALVAGQLVTLALNASAQPGDTLELIATRVTPGMVLTRLASPDATAQNNSARPSLSPTGQLISFLLTGQPASTPTTLANNQPLLPNALLANANANAVANANANAALGANPAASGANANAAALARGATGNVAASAHLAASTQLAPLLRQALSQSGLFYEAHQAQWLAGKVDLAALLREPQAQGAPPQPGQTTAHSAAPQAASTPAGQAAPTGGAAQTATAARSEAAAMSNAAAQSVARNEEPVAAVKSAIGQYAEGAMRNSQIAERLLPVVHQQLEALASQQYVWHGMAWPGQPFEWIVEDPRGDWHGGGEEADTEWNTTLRLSLPRLGGVEVRVNLTAAGAALRLKADDARAAAALQAHGEELAEALAAAGVPLTGMAVEAEQADDGR